MQNNSNPLVNSRRKRGFTLIEIMIAVAILGVLSMLAIPGFRGIQQVLKSTEMEAGARQIYIAVQNRLTVMKSAGTLKTVDPALNDSLLTENRVFWIAQDHMPLDYDNSQDSWNGQELCYVVGKNSDGSATEGKVIADILLSQGSVESLLLQNYCAIEYNPSNGTVYGVFYSDEYFLYSEVRDTDRTKATLRSIAGQPTIGYYGGIGSNIPDTGDADPADSTFIVENEETLALRVDPIATKNYTLTIESKLDPSAFNAYTYTFSGNQTEFTGHPNLSIDPTTGDIIVTLDRLQTGLHFSDLFIESIDNPAIVPGSDLRISLSVEDVNGDSLLIPSTTSKVVNSLFQSRSQAGAMISCNRHLQNLEPTVSGVSGIVGATLLSSLDWDASDSTSFVPISNPQLTSFLGSGNTIRNLSITSNGERCGLFGEFGGNATTPGIISGISIIDASVSGGNADYVGSLAGYLHDTTLTDCGVYVLNSAVASNGRLTASAADGVGGFVGASNNSTYTRCFSSLKDMIATVKGSSASSGVGGFAGISAQDTLSECYANTTQMTVTTLGTYAYSGGFAGRANSTIDYSYALGNIKQTDGTATGGFWYDFGGSAGQCYSATTFEQTTGLSGYSYGFSNRASTSCSYFSGAVPTYTNVISGITARDLSGLSSAYNNINWRTPASGTTHPYDSELSGQVYPISLVPTLAHYGNWPEETSGVQSVNMAYYEIYQDTAASTYSIGFYNAALELDTLSQPSSTKHIIQDGYAALFMADGASGMAQGISYTNLVSASYVKLTWTMNGSTSGSTNVNGMKEPKDLRYNSTNLENLVYYNGSIINSQSLLSLSSGNYYYRFLSAQQVVDADYARTAFFQSMKIDLYPSAAALSESYTFYYSPHFAKSPIHYSNNPGTTGMGPLSIRTMRHYVTLSLSAMSGYWNQGYSFTLENDVDFQNNTYTTNYFNQTITRRANPGTIGNSSVEFRGIFEGNGHTINQISIVTALNTKDYGVFGQTQNAAIRNLTVSAITINSATTKGVNHIGALIGNAYKTDISNINIIGVTLRGKYIVGGAIGKFDGGTVTNLSVSGTNSLNAGRLVGGVFGQISNASAVNISGVSLTGMNLQCPSWTETTDMSASMENVSAAYGTGGFAGGIALIENSDNDLVIDGISISSSSVQQSAYTGTSEAKYYAAALLVGNYHSKSNNINVSLSNVSIVGTTLYATPNGGDNSGAAYGGLFGKVYAAGTLTVADNCAIDSTSSLQRGTTSPTYSAAVGGYFGWMLGYGAATPLNVVLSSGDGEHNYGINFNWSAWNYLAGTYTGGIAGVIGTDTGFASVEIDGIKMNGHGGSTGGFAGALYSDISNVSLDNLTIIDDKARTGSNVGGFAGLISNAEIQNCDVRLSRIAGSATNPMTIGNTSTNDANLVNYVRGMGNVGGFAGKITGTSSTATFCFAAIGVTTIVNTTYANNLGGFVGLLENGYISDCYASGYVRLHRADSSSSRKSVTGGFVGKTVDVAGESLSPWIENCYSSGTVRHTTSLASGGFAGMEENGIILSCYTAGPNYATNTATYRRGFSGNKLSTEDTGYTSSLYYAKQPSSPGTNSTQRFASPELSRVVVSTALSNLKANTLSSTYFGGFTTITSAVPYISSLGTTYSYLGLTGVGRGVSGAVHYGIWIAP